MINKTLHLYWGKNQSLSFLRALTVLTFNKLNPTWSIKLWIPTVISKNKSWASGEQSEYTGKDYLHLLEKFICEFNFPDIDVNNKLPEVHKSDLLRWHLLGSEGGVWSDIDIMYINPITANMLDTQFKGTCLCRYEVVPKLKKLYQAIGFLASEGPNGRTFFYNLFEYGFNKMSKYRKDITYQAFGAELLDTFLRSWEGEEPNYLDHHMVYLYRFHKEIPKYFEDKELAEYENTLGYHWYAGNSFCSDKENEIHPETLEECAKKYIICRKALEVIT